MSLKSFIFAGFIAATTAGASSAATIVGYDILNASPNRTNSQTFDYTGTVTPSAAGIVGTVDLLGGTGSLVDGVVATTNDGLNPFSSDSSPNASITLYFDELIGIETIDLFGLDRIGNAFGGALTRVAVTIAGLTESFDTIGFGPENRIGRLVHDQIDLSGSALLGVATDQITLSGFETDGLFFGETFVLSEIAVTEAEVSVAPVPLPASGFLLLAGLAAAPVLRRRKKG